MRGKFITPWLVASIVLGGCTTKMLTLTPTAEESPELTAGIAQVSPALPPLARSPRYVLCGGNIACPHPTKKTLDMGDPSRNVPPVISPFAKNGGKKPATEITPQPDQTDLNHVDK